MSFDKNNLYDFFPPVYIMHYLIHFRSFGKHRIEKKKKYSLWLIYYILD